MSAIPPNKVPPAMESVRFKSAVSEAAIQGLAGNISFLMSTILPIGSVVFAFLTEEQFQAQTSDDWILADARNVEDSDYSLLTGESNVPDMRGRHARGKNNGRPTGGNTAELAIGEEENDKVLDHTHTTFGFIGIAEIGGPIVRDDGSEFDPVPFVTTGNVNSGNANATDNKVKSVTGNYFIRIN